MDKDELRQKLTPEQFRVTQEKATEAPFSGKYLDNKDDGMYHCIVCDTPLFSSETKFDSGTGWPSFTDPEVMENIETEEDSSHGMRRIEVKCKSCGSHLGHVFPDGPNNKNRYCINSCSLNFKNK